jgi:hypothetical protein
MKSVIVTTTINVPCLLKDYKAICDCDFVVVGDKKTPIEARSFCEDLGVLYLGVAEQEEYLDRFPELKEYLPYNCIQRRNVGILYAYEKGYEKIITIDDDNFVTGDYSHKLGEREIEVVSSDTGWFNVCSELRDVKERPFYHRGFPLEKRFAGKINKTKEAKNIVVNAGLWLGDPDIDAMTRLYYLNDPIDSISFSGNDIALDKDTWSPFNSQNTALHRSVIPAYFLDPYIGRYDDIWASYVVKKIADHLGDSIAFGSPIVRQNRNQHNYWKDLDAERSMEINLEFINNLRDIKPVGKTYFDCYEEIAEAMNNKGMKVWAKTIQRLQS